MQVAAGKADLLPKETLELVGDLIDPLEVQEVYVLPSCLQRSGDGRE